MADVKLKLTGLNKLMRSASVQAALNAEGGRIKARAGSKFRVTPRPHRWTARTFVEPVPGEAISDDDNLRLLRSLGG